VAGELAKPPWAQVAESLEAAISDIQGASPRVVVNTIDPFTDAGVRGVLPGAPRFQGSRRIRNALNVGGPVNKWRTLATTSWAVPLSS
jgi:hypothetical protein